MIKLKHISIYFVLLIFISSCGSTHYLKKGDKAYEELRYSVAIPLYEKGLAKKRPIKHLEKLAHSYREINNIEKAEVLYLEASEWPDASPIVEFYLGKMHMGNCRMAEAIKAFSLYLEKKPGDVVARMLLAACWSVDDRFVDTTLYEMQYMPANGFANAFSVTEYQNGVVFTGDKEVFRGKKKAEWTGNSYLDLYYMEKGDSGKWMSPVLLEGKLNGRYHEGPATFSKNGDVVYFTRSNYYKRKMIENGQNENNLKIFQSSLVDGKWVNLKELPINSDDYSCGHPTLGSDGQTLYFVSDMPGGFGGTDIYKTVNTEGIWSTPVNLGETINTPGDEMFPYVHRDGTLYFSSDAHNTMGGLDVFMSFYSEGRWMQPENLNYPLNTSWDDYGFSLLADDSTGFVSSSRLEGDKMFEFKKKAPTFYLYGKARKKGTDEKVSGVIIEITQASNNKIHQMVSDKNGEFKMKLTTEEVYNLYCTKIGCFSRTDQISTKGLNISQDFFADFEVEEIIIGKPIVLENIFYDFDKWNIREDAAIELNKLVKILEDNPEINIEMGSHTDARGTDSYNLVLSDKRARSTVTYLIYKGIEPNRLTWRGYGETVPVNQCINKVECSDEEHQINRRTEFKVTKK